MNIENYVTENVSLVIQITLSFYTDKGEQNVEVLIQILK
jgi:hypothetical protein